MKMIINRGIPGSGKTSHWTRRDNPDLQGSYIVCSADFFFYKFNPEGNTEYQFDPKKLKEAHGACFRRAIEAVLSGGYSTIVIDNTNIELDHISPYLALANAYGIEVEIHEHLVDVEVAIQRNVHQVPAEVIRRMDARKKEVILPLTVKYVAFQDGVRQP